MKVKTHLIFSSCFILICFACKGQQTINSSNQESYTFRLNTPEIKQTKLFKELTKNSWILVTLNNKPFKKLEGMLQDSITLNFTPEGYYSTSDGCNGIGGIFTLQGNEINFEIPMASKRHCDGEIALNLYHFPITATKIRIKNNRLELLSKENEVLAIYKSH